MTSKTKIFGITVAVMAVAALLIYVPLTLASSQNNYRNEDTNLPMPMLMNAETQRPIPIGGFRHELLRRFLANSTPVEIQGTVVTLVRRMLVVDTDGGQVRILMPYPWTAEGNTLETADLFETSYLTTGQEITVKTLKGTLVTRPAYSIYVLFGYEIVNASDVHAYAVLPFNIETL